VLERKPLCILMNPLQRVDKCVVCFHRTLNRNVVRLFEADGLKQLTPNVFKAAGLAEVDFAAEVVLLDGEIEDFGFTHDGGNCCGVGFICVCVASELVEFLDAFFRGFLGAFCGLCLQFVDAIEDFSLFEQTTGINFG